MISVNLIRSAATLTVMAGLLAVAGPAGAQVGGADHIKPPKPASTITMLDYEGSPVITYNGHAGLGAN